MSKSVFRQIFCSPAFKIRRYDKRLTFTRTGISRTDGILLVAIIISCCALGRSSERRKIQATHSQKLTWALEFGRRRPLRVVAALQRDPDYSRPDEVALVARVRDARLEVKVVPLPSSERLVAGILALDVCGEQQVFSQAGAYAGP